MIITIYVPCQIYILYQWLETEKYVLLKRLMQQNTSLMSLIRKTFHTSNMDPLIQEMLDPNITELKQKGLHKITLTFNDPALESKFNKIQFTKIIRRLKIIILFNFTVIFLWNLIYILGEDGGDYNADFNNDRSKKIAYISIVLILSMIFVCFMFLLFSVKGIKNTNLICNSILILLFLYKVSKDLLLYEDNDMLTICIILMSTSI